MAEPTTEIEQIEKAIAALEAQRAESGDGMMDVALEALHKRLADLRRQAARPQRKQVTVLFATLAIPAAAGDEDAEDTHARLRALWERLEPVVLAHGGWIDKIVEGMLMALWGAETAREDDAEQAVRAALEMEKALAESRPAVRRKKHLLPAQQAVTLRAGIHSGPVILNEVGTIGEYTAIGDTVNTARRLQQAAAAGEVLVSQQTQLLVQGLFDTQALEPLHVKGKSTPLRVHRVLQARQRAFRMHTRGIEGLETHMVGRQAQLQAMQEAFHRSIEGGQAQLVAVFGDAGVGKSRLLFEFERWLSGQGKQPVLFQGRASADTIHSAYSLFRDMFVSRFNIHETDRAAQVLKKISRGTQPHLNKQQAALVGHLVGFDLSSYPAVKNLLGSPTFRQSAAAHLVSYFRALAGQAPGAVIFLEDLHWADQSSLDLVEHLAAEIPHGRLLAVCLARQTLLERRPKWGARLPQSLYQRLDLAPLTDEESRALVQEILRKVSNLPASLCTLIAESAEGNPFYVEELVKMLIADGVIVRSAECWQVLLEQLKETHLPPTLTGVLQARLAGLPDAEQEVLRRASVVGRTFWKGTLDFLSHEDHAPEGCASLDGCLHALNGRELIYQRATSAFASTEEFIFKHAILRDVTYETVLRRVRRLYHTRVANWLEANAGDRLNEYLGLIASHYERAGDAFQTAVWSRRAGEAALNANAYLEALAHFERAYTLTPAGDGTGRAGLLVQMGEVHRQVGNYKTSASQYEEGLALPGITLTDHFQALLGLAFVHTETGAYLQAFGALDQAAELGKAQATPLQKAWLTRIRGHACYRHGDIENAFQYFEASLAAFRQIPDATGIIRSLNGLGLVALQKQDYTTAAHYFEESLAIARKIGDLHDSSVMLHNLGLCAAREGRWGQVEAYEQESLAIAQALGDRHSTCLALMGLAELGVHMKHYSQAHQYILDFLRISAQAGALPIMLAGLYLEADICTYAGERIRAAEITGLVQNHPSIPSELPFHIKGLLERLHQSLPADQLEQALARGKGMDLESVVREILEAG